MLGLGTFALLSNPHQFAALRDHPALAESVVVSVMAANRDPARFPDPDRLDVAREATGHLAFGHGIHQCLGQQLARVELRLAVPASEVPIRPAINVHGLHRLPVTWDTP